jgi:ribosomal protein L37AE/L43A
MNYQKEKFGSAEYSPTPSHALPAFRGGIARGYVCPKCGHLSLEENELLGLTCPKCFQVWAEKNITQMITVKDAIEKDKEQDFALEPTKSYTPNTKEFKVATTVIIHATKPKRLIKEETVTEKVKDNYIKTCINYVIGIFNL